MQPTSRPVLSLTLLVALGGGMAGCGGSGSTFAPPAPLSPSISVTSSSKVDAANSLVNSGNSTQSGDVVLVSNSVETISSFTGNPAPVPPAVSFAQAGTLVNEDDGAGARIKMSGSWNGAPEPAETDGLFSDVAFDLANGSPTRTLRVTFRVDLSRLVTATGSNAYAFSDLSIRDAGNNELYFFERRVDTANPVNNLNAESTTDMFSVDVPPSTTSRITGLLRQRGAALGNGDVYRNDVDALVVLDSVVEI